MPPIVVSPKFFGLLDLVSGCLGGLFHEAMGQNQIVASMKETQNAIDVPAERHPALPNLISVAQLLEVLARNDAQFLNELKHPSHFLGDLWGKRIKELSYRALSSFGPVEDERPSHSQSSHIC